MQCTQTRALIDKCTLITIPSCKYQPSGTNENRKLQWPHSERSRRTKIYMYKICTVALYTSKYYKNHTSCTSPTWHTIINKIFKDVTWHVFSRCCDFIHNSFKCQSWTQIYCFHARIKKSGASFIQCCVETLKNACVWFIRTPFLQKFVKFINCKWSWNCVQPNAFR